MSTAQASTYSSSSHGHSHRKSSSRSSKPSTTPRGHPVPPSVGQSHPPLLSPKGRSPHPKDLKSPSPSYFGFVVNNDDSIPPDSNPGHHARQNWNFPTSQAQNGNSPRHVPVDGNPDFEAFRRQSEQGIFNLHTGSFSSLTNLNSKPPQVRTLSSTVSGPQSPISPITKRPHLDKSRDSNQGKQPGTGDAYFDFPPQDSPLSLTPRLGVSDHHAPRLSLPGHELQTPTFNFKVRSDTLPPKAEDKPASMVSPTAVADLLRANKDILILDLRVYQQYVHSRIKGALNLCIPTTLLKRPSFTTRKLLETFSSESDKQKFQTWSVAEYILVYDASSAVTKEAAIPFNVLKKFTAEGWKGTGLVVKGGLQAFAQVEPDHIERGAVNTTQDNLNGPLSIAPPSKIALPVAGGCAMPSTKNAANPFFGNIRQNMDLLDGVGQIPVQKPANMSDSTKQSMPIWLKEASRTSDDGKAISQKFLRIEESEQKRMQNALNSKVSYGTPGAEVSNRVQVAGIEKGSKNRYNNIFPYEHSRVRLQGCETSECDYINANHVKADYSNRQYIATQAPIPGTFNDFWRVVWEQDVHVIVMLTAENEGGLLKSHPYWKAGEYGPVKIKVLAERTVSLDNGETPSPTPRTPGVSHARPSMGMRRSTTNSVPKETKDSKSSAEKPAVVLRTLALTHSNRPFEPMRQITQLHYSQWPDFGAPASPTALLSLMEQVNKYVRGSASHPGSVNQPALKNERPIIVHCSAGCGRTGTFCTIDSVIDMMKRQRLDQHRDDDSMDVDVASWVRRDDEDLVAKAVDDFRHQRLSMVQNLRQFVLCYESIMQWLVTQRVEEKKLGKTSEHSRKST